MKEPIFVYGDGYILVFSTREKAEGYLEAIDVANNIYKVYDSEGYQLEVSVTPDNAVAINPTVPPVKKDDELYEMLQRFLKAVKGVSDEWLASASLSELVIKALDFKTR